MTVGEPLSQAEATLWSRCARALQAELSDQEFNTWIRPLQAVAEGSELRLLAPNRFVINWVVQRPSGRSYAANAALGQGSANRHAS
jgi:hypothetical protein